MDTTGERLHVADRERAMTTDDFAMIAIAMLIAGALIGTTAVVGGYGVLLARRMSMAGSWVVALLFLLVAAFGAVALPWVAPGWAVGVAGLGALFTALPLWLLLRSRWLVEEQRPKP